MKPIPYCPYSHCPSNHKDFSTKVSFRKKGFEHNQQQDKIQRYQCKCCLRTFNITVFDMDRYTHIKISYKDLAEQLISSSGIRDMARKLNCSPHTVQNRLDRLARKMMYLNADIKNGMTLKENMTADGLESFVLSQFFPSNINVLAGSDSQFIYDFNAFYFHRKGRMTEEQKKQAEKLYQKARFVDRGPSKSFKEVLDVLADLKEQSQVSSLILDTDENQIYHHQMKRHQRMKGVKHRKTNSRVKRDTHNKLFSCNYIDRMIRKNQAEHIRETVQFAKNMNNSMSRFTIYTFCHNFILPHRVNEYKTSFKSHAEAAGILRKTVEKTKRKIYDSSGYHYFRIKDSLTPFQQRIWEKKLMNPLNIRAV